MDHKWEDRTRPQARVMGVGDNNKVRRIFTMDMHNNQILAVRCSMDVRQLCIITFSSETTLAERASFSVVLTAVN